MKNWVLIVLTFIYLFIFALFKETLVYGSK